MVLKLHANILSKNVQKIDFFLMCGERGRDTNYLAYLACNNCQQVRWLRGGHWSLIMKKSTPDSVRINWINL